MNKLELLEVNGIGYEKEKITFTYIGVSSGLKYIQPFIQKSLIHSNVKISKITRIDIFSIGEFLRSLNSDLLVIAANKELVSSFYTPRSFIMPFRIHLIVNTNQGWNIVQSNISRSEVKRNQKSKELYSLDYYITHNDEDFYQFYDEMHKPTMERRFGYLARSVERDEAFRTLFKQGVLFLITKNGIPISGCLSQLNLEKRWLNARLIGILNGDEIYRNIGGQRYVYHSILHWASNEKEIDVVDFQGCEPFLTKGTFEYKKRLGTKAILPPNNFSDLRVLVKPNFSSLSIRQFLINNPVILINDDKSLGVGYFFDFNNEPRLDITYKSPGFEFERRIDID